MNFNELLRNNDKLDFTESRKFKISLAISVSLFSLLILIIFQPFGINNYNHESRITLLWLFYIFTIGMGAFAFFIIGEFLIRPIVVKKLTYLNLILWFIMELIFVGSCLFFYYNFLGGFHDFTWSGWLIFVLNTFFVTVIPCLGTIFFFHYRMLKKEYSNILSLSNEKSNLNDLILISGDYKKDKIALPPENIVYINSQDNYAALCYLEDNKLKSHLIRSSLGSMEKVLNQTFLLRCNRSMIVNLEKLESFVWKRSKLELKLKHYSEPILVTNKYLPHVNKILETHFS